MAFKLRFYMDDSGSRVPNSKPLGSDAKRPDAFALGGVLAIEDDLPAIKARHGDFCRSWNISYPLRSYDIRNRKNKFAWLGLDATKRIRFLRELGDFVCGLPVLALACVIDRPGYDGRYRNVYSARERWHLCKTAFCISVERACKHALREGKKLRVCPEKADPASDARLETYYNELRTSGMPFDVARSTAYQPLTDKELSRTLHELDFKTKKSELAQIADLCLWPILQAGYGAYDPHEQLKQAGRLIECVYSADEIALRGSKYSCFDAWRAAS
jgi:hypothetical protein